MYLTCQRPHTAAANLNGQDANDFVKNTIRDESNTAKGWKKSCFLGKSPK